MSFRTWRQWLRALPWPMQWFAWLVLVRPIIDVFWFVKDVSPALSPLNIVGVLTPVAILASLFSSGLRRRTYTFADGVMFVWAGLLFFNALAGLTFGVTDTMLEISLRMTYPAFLYIYAIHLVRSRTDLHGFLTTFLYSTAFPFAMLLYEQGVSPLSNTVVTRGFERYEGLYADVNSYAAYVSGAFLVSAFFFMEQNAVLSVKKRGLFLAIIGALTIVGLLSMHHAASWAVCGTVAMLLALHTLGKGHARLAIVFLVICLPGYLLLGETIASRVEMMFGREMKALQGETPFEGAFHGRMTRWERQLASWQNMPAEAKILGIAAVVEPTADRVGAGIHNDYLRILFSSGVLGLTLYLAFFLIVFIKTLARSAAERFLVRGTMAVVLLYSVSGTVTTSLPLLYLAITILAYGASSVCERRMAHRAVLNRLSRYRSPISRDGDVRSSRSAINRIPKPTRWRTQRT